MIERYVDFLGLEETVQLLEANERPLITSIRANTLKIGVDKLKKRLESKGFKLEPIEWISSGFKVLNQPLNLGSLHEYLQGYYYLQNVASMIPAIILNPEPSDIVIDMCAAPGSKATQLAQIMKNYGTLILIDKNKDRIPSLEINLRRMGIMNAIVLNMDALNVNKMNFEADKILLDAPCTGEGLIRQDINRKKSKTMSDINKLAFFQKKLLKAGLEALKPNGYLLYSTCSIAPQENELVVHQVLDSLPNFSVCKINVQYGVNGFTKVYEKSLRQDLRFSQRLYPHLHNTIGFFLCLIKRIS